MKYIQYAGSRKVDLYLKMTFSNNRSRQILSVYDNSEFLTAGFLIYASQKERNSKAVFLPMLKFSGYHLKTGILLEDANNPNT